MTNSEHILNLFLASMEAEVEAEHQDNDTSTVGGDLDPLNDDLDPLNDDSDWTDPGVPGDFDFTVGG
jgi:hypothetical protein